VLLLKDIRPQLLVYHGDWRLGGFVQFISRAKDELVTPTTSTPTSTRNAGPRSSLWQLRAAAARLEPGQPRRCETFARPTHDIRATTREARGETPDYKADAAAGSPIARPSHDRRHGQRTGQLVRGQRAPRIDALAATYVVDAPRSRSSA
jgi:hypothetical protein